METVLEGTEVNVIEKSLDVFRNGGNILLANQDRVRKALVVAGNIIKNWDDANALVDPELKAQALQQIDERSNKFLANCGTAKTEMEDSRKAITQLMTVIRTMFTEEENKLDSKKADTLPAKIQLKRNDYAKFQLAEQERKRKEAEARAAKNTEAINIRSYIKNAITSRLLDYLSNKKIKMNDSFNEISLETFEQKSINLNAMDIEFPKSKLAEIIKYPDPTYRLHDFTGYNTIRTEEHAAYTFEQYYQNYRQIIGEMKQSLIDRLPAKKQELDDIAEQQRIAEENDRKLKEARNEADRKAAEKKQLEIEANQRKLAAEKQQRELDDKVRMQKEDEQRKLEADQKAELERTSASTQVMFEQAADSALTAPAPEVRNGYDIQILHKAGIVELFQFWFSREAVTLSIDDMMKKSLSQIKTYAEGVAKSSDVKIESKNLRYETSVKSVNRKVR